ncbi:hypothetical protein [Actinomadura montaniterrae]|uniref:hypothetical protein n=1 Tax=Actinomadura montaniterrae TaxID=1803903 RepID=UPI001CEF6916|nr:hypothetical protein [Actinomadura montaniterrae]
MGLSTAFTDMFGVARPIALAAGTALIVQVTDMEEARRAVDLGADVIVAQGTEAGMACGRCGSGRNPGAGAALAEFGRPG